MNKKEDLAYVVGCFIEKYWKYSKQVKWPDWEFTITNVFDVKVEANSLIEVRPSLWTFDGSVQLSYTDKSQVTMTKKHTIIGNANAIFSSSESLFETKNVTITKIGL